MNETNKFQQIMNKRFHSMIHNSVVGR